MAKRGKKKKINLEEKLRKQEQTNPGKKHVKTKRAGMPSPTIAHENKAMKKADSEWKKEAETYIKN